MRHGDRFGHLAAGRAQELLLDQHMPAVAYPAGAMHGDLEKHSVLLEEQLALGALMDMVCRAALVVATSFSGAWRSTSHLAWLLLNMRCKWGSGHFLSVVEQIFFVLSMPTRRFQVTGDCPFVSRPDAGDA